ncbi:hypothetical protein QBC34DRAFT_495797 [Podospora aff. communis PSN243]|uniref:Uncharacterized protein n=1 Tax=Podospora aff. communis PSN243 TaxID=3040156 RepID=A0AAV9GJ42_9PEZI|nr:hypothetical protein QBC34DRAFT_495797 [Podospora aff. communis PSN243]
MADNGSRSSLRAFDVLNVKNRVVTPSRRLPLISLDDDAIYRICRHFKDEFEKRAIEMAVESCGIERSDVRVCITSRYFRYNIEDSQPTVLIVVDRGDSSEWSVDVGEAWEKVVGGLKEYIDQRISDHESIGPIDISVEMLSSDLVRKKFMSALDPSDKSYHNLLKAWPSIRTGVSRILESYSTTAGHMTAISLFHLGFDDVDFNCDENGWPEVLDAMQQYVDGFNFKLHVHMEHNLVQHAGLDPFTLAEPNLTPQELQTKKEDFSTPIERPYKTSVNLGDDIGAATYITRPDGKLSSPIVGTLGCWLEVKTKTEGWKGYTVGDPVKHLDLWQADVNGVSTSAAQTPGALSLVEHPTRRKHNLSVALLRGLVLWNTVEDEPPAEEEAELDNCVAFFDQEKMYFGSVYLASEFLQRYTHPTTAAGAADDAGRTGRLDWALILPNPKRIGSNNLPTRAQWQENEVFDHKIPLKVSWGAPLKLQVNSLHTVGPNFEAFKVGASTRCTAGIFSGTRSEIKIAEEAYMPGRSENLNDRTSCESTFIGYRADAFGKRGDSGAVVWDWKGHALGLLFGGQSPNQCDGQYSLVTPIEEVFQSIIDMSDGEVLEVKIRQE